MQNKDGSIDVTVTGASLYNQKGELFAPTLMGNGATTLSPTPSQGNLYISTAYFQMVAPLDKNEHDNKKYQLEISDSNMKVPYQDGLGNSLVSTTQSITTNDTVIRDYPRWELWIIPLYRQRKSTKWFLGQQPFQ